MNGWQALGFKSYKDYIQSPFWINKKMWIIDLRKCCEECGSLENLNVHHTNYINVGNEGMDDIELLCKICHKVKHGKELTDEEFNKRNDYFLKKYAYKIKK